MEISIEALRDIITGKQQYRKCPCCDHNGLKYWEDSGTCVLPYPHKDWGTDYTSGNCESCNGLAFLPLPRND